MPQEFMIDGNDIFFKEGGMIAYSHYGRLYTAVPTETEHQFEIKKFNPETQGYMHTNELTTFEIYGQQVEVKNGYATAIPPEPVPEPEPEATAEQLIMQSLADSEIRDYEAQYERELIAQQLTDIEISMIGGGTI